MKPSISMRVVDWWVPDTQENFYENVFIQLLSRKYDVRYSENPDFLLYGPFGYAHLRYDCVRIFFTGENVRADWRVADYSIDFDHIDFGDRHLRLPLDFLPSAHLQTLCEHSRTRALQAFAPKREKFCAFMARHSDKYTWMRERFFEILSQYKQVDSGGQWNNNIGGVVGDRGDEGDYRISKRKWLEGYKFNICFENASYPGYLTEKLFDAYACGCIPIYWGDPTLRCGQENMSKTYKGGGIAENAPKSAPKNACENAREAINTTIPHIAEHLRDYTLNPKAFINAHNFPTLHDLAQEVIRIDTDTKSYEEMYLQPLFLGDFDPYTYYEAKLMAFLDSIFSQNAKDALRREENGFAELHLSLLRRGDNPKRYYKNKLRNKALKILGLPPKYKV